MNGTNGTYEKGNGMAESREGFMNGEEVMFKRHARRANNARWRRVETVRITAYNRVNRRKSLMSRIYVMEGTIFTDEKSGERQESNCEAKEMKIGRERENRPKLALTHRLATVSSRPCLFYGKIDRQRLERAWKTRAGARGL
jgi:hypothetical protein